VQTGDKDTVNAVDDGEYPFYVRSQTVEQIDSFTFDCEAVLTAGDGVGVGKVFHHHRDGPFDFHQRVYMMSDFRHVIGRFFFYFLREQFYKVALEGNAKSTVDSLRRPLFMDFQFTVPPLPEQAAIAAYLDEETAKLDALVGKVEEAAERLQEYRTALITAAVTGKIDVRAVKR
jgi:type I restriction enzyme S subunit